jgi:hypothetical protein
VAEYICEPKLEMGHHVDLWCATTIGRRRGERRKRLGYGRVLLLSRTVERKGRRIWRTCGVRQAEELESEFATELDWDQRLSDSATGLFEVGHVLQRDLCYYEYDGGAPGEPGFAFGRVCQSHKAVEEGAGAI